jgi:hypothetical protein
MANHFGIDAASTAQQVVPTTTARLRKPEWIGRYLCELPGISSGLTQDEVAYIHGQGMGLLLIYNGATIGSVRGTSDDGRAEGERAVALAKTLGAGTGVAIVADIESNMYPTPNWITGFVSAIANAGYVGGLYGNANVQAFVTAYQTARQWSFAPCFFYASEPELNNWFDTVRTDFTPLPVPHFEAEAVWHQYSENCLGGTVDLDVCNDMGWSLLWHPAPLVHTTTVVHDCKIKHFPSHIGRGLYAHGTTTEYVLKAGTVVTFTGKVTPHWCQVVAGTYTGWMLRNNLRTI